MTLLSEIGIKTDDLIIAVEALLVEAEKHAEEMGAVNWGDISISDIQYRLSAFQHNDGPFCVVILEEASPDCRLGQWITERLDAAKFPRTFIECEW